MDQICLVVPILPGKTPDARDFMRELEAGRNAEYQASEQRIGIVKEAWYLARTAAGDQLVAYMESPDFARALSMFSKDGRRIVVAADRGGFLSALWVMRSNGTGLRRITRPSLEAFWPSWSPDGRRILFTDNCCQSGSNIWTVRPDGTGLTKLTHFGPAPLQGGFASYSANGRQIVLQYDGKCPARGICQYFYVMNANGSGLHPVRTGVANTFLTAWGQAV